MVKVLTVAELGNTITEAIDSMKFSLEDVYVPDIDSYSSTDAKEKFIENVKFLESWGYVVNQPR